MMKLFDTFVPAEFQEGQQPVDCMVKIIAVVVVVNDLRWDPQVPRNSKGEVVPLHKAVKVFVAWDAIQQGSKTRVHPPLRLELANAVHRGAKETKARGIVRVFDKPVGVVEPPVPIVNEMIPSHNIVEWVSDKMNRLCHQVDAVCHGYCLNLSVGVSVGPPATLARDLEGPWRFNVFLAVSTDTAAVSFGENVVVGDCRVLCFHQLQERSVHCIRLDRDAWTIPKVSLQRVVGSCCGVGRLPS